MKIVYLKIIRGPNYWSNHRKNLIRLKLDLEEYKDTSTNMIEGFTENLVTLIPSLYEHRCSVGTPGGFIERLKIGTYFGHVVEHIALELQTLAGMDCGFGRARETADEGVYQIVFSHKIENAGIYAAHAAIKIVEILARKEQYKELSEDIEELKYIYARDRLGPSTENIILEAEKRDIPCTRLNDNALVMFGQGCYQKLLWATTTSYTSSIAVDLVADKTQTKKILEDSHIPVPQGMIARSIEELEIAIEKFGFPLVIKPNNSNHGQGVITNISTREKALLAFTLSKKIAHTVIVERYIQGDDYRFLLINYKLIAVAKRTPAMIVGDGILSIQQLIDEVNQNPLRGMDHENVLTAIKIDENTKNILIERGLTLESILEKEQILYLKDVANISTGGTATDVTDLVHPDNIFLAERVARLLNLDICGIDVIAQDVGAPINNTNGAILEVNAAPGFRMHLAPTHGKKRNVAAPVLDMLFPSGAPCRIPLVAVTGTNGKTTVVRLIAHLAMQAGYSVGWTTTEGIYIQDKELYRGDCSGPTSARTVLCDPLVNFAVLECARGGILRSGLGFDKCDISIITNISEDHLGLEDIHTLEQLARAKSVVALSTDRQGYCILNADDDLVFEISNTIACNLALFSTDHKNPRIIEHCARGGLAGYIENDKIILSENNHKISIINVTDIPITMEGKLDYMRENVLPAVITAWLNQIPLEILIAALKNFKLTPTQMPGRMNLYTFSNCKILLDYAHNERAYQELKKFITKMTASRKVAIIAGTGDRRSKDIMMTGTYAAQIFDEIIIRNDKDPRGRTNKEINDLLLQGILQCNPNIVTRLIGDEFEAIKFAIQNATPDTFIWYFPDKVLDAIHFLDNYAAKFPFKTLEMSI